jgi:hypothetical protein
MLLTEIINLADGQLLTEGPLDPLEILGGCGADLMSDVLTSSQPGGVLLTGLCNPQVVRTALMADLRAIIFVRGKIPPTETLVLAEAEGLPLISSPSGMYEISGRLFSAGLPSLEVPVDLFD